MKKGPVRTDYWMLDVGCDWFWPVIYKGFSCFMPKIFVYHPSTIGATPVKYAEL